MPDAALAKLAEDPLERLPCTDNGFLERVYKAVDRLDITGVTRSSLSSIISSYSLISIWVIAFR